MDGSQQPPAGFSTHVQGQLLEAVQAVTAPQQGRGRGQNKRGRGRYQPLDQSLYPGASRPYASAPQFRPQRNAQQWGNQVMTNRAEDNSFPPLDATRASASAVTQQQNRPIPPQQNVQPQFYQPQSAVPHQSQNLRGEHGRGRGGPFRGRGYHHQANHQYQQQQQHQHQHQPHSTAPFRQQNPNDFHRPAPAQRKLFASSNQPQFNTVEEQRAYQRKVMDQADFLNHLANASLKNQLTTEEQQAKECFRKELETIAQKVVAAAITDTMQLKPEHVRLKLYGSLGSGFAVAGSDMDLLLAFPQDEGPLGDIEIESRRLLEKALLDAGIGARLLTNTRVPILRVCQSPDAELLKNLREYRLSWDNSLENEDLLPASKGFDMLPTLTVVQTDAAAQALAALDLDAHNVPLPASPTLEASKLEFTNDCGIQCDINFTNYVALHNTRLLKTYGMCDPRVRQVGVFVKQWAKARDINTPYRSTLSSYGYIMMVLHYLMNVVNPPILPNLQDLARQKDTWEGKTEVELVDGFDVRFIRDVNEVQAIIQEMPRNRESVGALLRGFFWYYADPRGFHWNQDVISIRSRNGQLSKQSKGWTGAKWAGDNQTVRLRYLLAIEDPFELEHNVGRTVGHSGIVAIRDEFRKAWATIEHIAFDNEARAWFWTNQDGEKVSGDDMMAACKNRGDLFRKDQDYHRQKVHQLRQDLEAKERALQSAAAQEAESVEGTGLNGTSEVNSQSIAQHAEPLTAPQSTALINDGGFQVKTQQKQWRQEVIPESEVQAEMSWDTPAVTTTDVDWSKPFSETEIPTTVEWTSSLPNEDVTGGQDNQWPIQPDDQWRQVAEPENPSTYETKIVQQVQANPKCAEDHVNVSENNKQLDDLNKTPSEEHVDVIIQWTTQSRAGRWLRWRDKQIRSGNRKRRISPKYQQLDRDFPYNPNMTLVELALKNKTLVSLYQHSFQPIDPNETKMDHAPNTAPDSSHNMDLITKSNSDQQIPRSHSQRELADLTTSLKDEMVVPVEKKKYRNPQKKRKKSNATTADDPDPRQTSRETDKPTHGPVPPQTHNSVHNHKGMAATHAAKQTPAETVKPTSNVHPPNSQIMKLVQQYSQMSNLPSSQTTQTQNNIHGQLVPSTQQPSTPKNHRPRHKDPHVTSKPRKPGFQLDPRQLADLDIIRRGGNGCARVGEEFEIGAFDKFGEVADDPSMTKSSVRKEWSNTETVWEAKGDDKGLLGELPRSVVRTIKD